MKDLIVIKCFFLTVLIICTLACERVNNENNIIVKVDKFSISKSNVAKRTSILELDNIQNAQDYALFQLTKMACLEYLMFKLEISLSDSILNLEAQRIDARSLRPEKIRLIKKICGDHHTYLSMFIKESLAPRMLFDEFKWNQGIHQEQGDLVKEYFSEILNDRRSFEKDSLYGQGIKDFILDERGLRLLQNNVDQRPIGIPQNVQGLVDPSVQNRMSQMMNSKNDFFINQLKDVIRNTNSGSFHERPIQTEDAFWIMQIKRKEGNSSWLRVLSIPKKNFNSWLEREMATIPIIVKDKFAWKSMMEIIPTAKSQFTNFELSE